MAADQHPKRKRGRWFQWSLRSLIVVMLLAGVGIGWLGRERKTGPERIYADDDKVFGEKATRIDFERTPAGAPLAPKTDISKMYVPSGCVFSTSFAGSFIAVQSYNVGGRSGGRCAANQNPLYQGVMTIRFCEPGNEQVAAGVTKVGFWISHVRPAGTALEAYDDQGRLIQTIKTIKERKDFLALKSDVPIAYIKVVPDLDVDPDFAIDDLMFDTPQRLKWQRRR